METFDFENALKKLIYIVEKRAVETHKLIKTQDGKQANILADFVKLKTQEAMTAYNTIVLEINKLIEKDCSKWISSDNHPPDEKSFIGIDSLGNIDRVFYDTSYKEWAYYKKPYFISADITHYIPLPTPPNERISPIIEICGEWVTEDDEMDTFDTPYDYGYDGDGS
jgi:hypothetical protein